MVAVAQSRSPNDDMQKFVSSFELAFEQKHALSEGSSVSLRTAGSSDDNDTNTAATDTAYVSCCPPSHTRPPRFGLVPVQRHEDWLRLSTVKLMSTRLPTTIRLILHRQCKGSKQGEATAFTKLSMKTADVEEEGMLLEWYSLIDMHTGWAMCVICIHTHIALSASTSDIVKHIGTLAATLLFELRGIGTGPGLFRWAGDCTLDSDSFFISSVTALVSTDPDLIKQSGCHRPGQTA